MHNKSTKFEDLIDGRDNGINLVFKKSLSETSIEVFEIIFSDDDEDYNHLGKFYSQII